MKLIGVTVLVVLLSSVVAKGRYPFGRLPRKPGPSFHISDWFHSLSNLNFSPGPGTGPMTMSKDRDYYRQLHNRRLAGDAEDAHSRPKYLRRCYFPEGERNFTFLCFEKSKLLNSNRNLPNCWTERRNSDVYDPYDLGHTRGLGDRDSSSLELISCGKFSKNIFLGIQTIDGSSRQIINCLYFAESISKKQFLSF